MQMEQRFAQEVRATGRTLSGYVARFDNEASIGGFTEVIRRGAFRASLDSGADILALADHSPDKVLGRTRSGTLELHEDSEGLAFTLSLPDTQSGRDLVALAQRGDLGGCSFGFTVDADGESWDGTRRELRSVQLHEVSIVQSWPAYANTTVNLRHRNPDIAELQLALMRYWLETAR
ncbi:HK97 family phage prohead protease [Stenotrophomonas rhizophila]|uniref:HK97 family phage prohead protease n=1 Tax=Stenotrophomonas TaxID=40323 RepID=UPI003B7AF61B